MRDLRDKVAVVTGAASGIGAALAARLAAEGMRLVLADVEGGALEAAGRELRSGGATVLEVPTDVARADDVERLATRAYADMGAVHLLCNNAGVALSGLAWEHTLADWEWVLGVNLWGVVHGVRSFVPRMLASGAEGHVVNTASMAGLTSNPFMAAYNVSKHGVVTLSETLHKDLVLTGAPIGVSVLCPGFVRTRITESARNRPASLGATVARPRPASIAQAVDAKMPVGLAPDEVARRVVEAVRTGRFYVLTDERWVERVRARSEEILAGRTPDPSPTFG